MGFDKALACATSALMAVYLENTARVPTDAARPLTSTGLLMEGGSAP